MNAASSGILADIAVAGYVRVGERPRLPTEAVPLAAALEGRRAAEGGG